MSFFLKSYFQTNPKYFIIVNLYEMDYLKVYCATNKLKAVDNTSHNKFFDTLLIIMAEPG